MQQVPETLKSHGELILRGWLVERFRWSFTLPVAGFFRVARW